MTSHLESVLGAREDKAAFTASLSLALEIKQPINQT